VPTSSSCVQLCNKADQLKHSFSKQRISRAQYCNCIKPKWRM